MSRRGVGRGCSRDGMISKRGSGSGQYIVTQAKRTKAGTFIRRGRLIHNCGSPRVYVRSVGGGVYRVCVCVPPSLSFAREESGTRLRLVTFTVTLSQAT